MIGLLGLLASNWWLLALRGLFAVLFALAAFFWPEMTLTVLVLLFGAYAMVDGVAALFGAFNGAAGGRRWPLLLEALVGIGAGIAALVWPNITALVLLYLIAFQAMATGLFQVLAAIRLREEIHGEWLLGLAGVASMLFGLLMVAFPGAGAVAVVWTIGAYALVFGVLLLAVAFRLRGLRDRITPAAGMSMPGGTRSA